MSIKIMTLVFGAGGLTPAQKIVALALADNAHEDGSEARPSVATLVKKAGMSERSVQRMLKDLIGLGVIEIQRYEDRARGHARWYRFILAPDGFLRSQQWPDDGVPDCHPASESRVPTASHRVPTVPSPGATRATLTVHEPSIEPSTSEPSFGPDVETLCNELADSIEANGSKRPVVTKAWRVEMDRLLRLDGKTPTQVGNMIRWCQGDPFWRSNILSVVKLRAKYDQMRLSAMRETKVGPDVDEVKRVERAKAEAKAWEDEVARRHEASTPMPAGFKAILRKGNRD